MYAQLDGDWHFFFAFLLSCSIPPHILPQKYLRVYGKFFSIAFILSKMHDVSI